LQRYSIGFISVVFSCCTSIASREKKKKTHRRAKKKKKNQAFLREEGWQRYLQPAWLQIFRGGPKNTRRAPKSRLVVTKQRFGSEGMKLDQQFVFCHHEAVPRIPLQAEQGAGKKRSERAKRILMLNGYKSTFSV